MKEQLLSAKESARKLGISLRSFYRFKHRLIARGMQQIRAGGRVTFREASIDFLIKKCAEEEIPLY